MLISSVARCCLTRSSTALVAAADEHDLVQLRKLLHDSLGEGASLGGQEYHGGLGLGLPDRLHRLEQGLRLHQHARSAAELVVVHGPVPVVGGVADVDEVQLDKALL